MNLEEFTEKIAKDLQTTLPHKYAHIKVIPKNVEKIGGSYMGIELKPEGSISPLLKAEKYYGYYTCSIIEVMGRNTGYIALWCGIANGAEDILLPERYNYDEQELINYIINNRKYGRKHHIIINAEGIIGLSGAPH